jgi:acyl-CoA thioesterase I
MAVSGPERSSHREPKTKGRGYRRFITFAIVLAFLVSQSKGATEDTAPNATDSKTSSAEFVATALNPFWRANEIREPLFFVEENPSDRPTGKLLFKPTEVLSISTSTRDTKFEPGKDFLVDLAAGTISLPPGSRIPVTTQEHLYPLMTSDLPKSARKSGDRTRGIFFSEGSVYHKLQVEVTYRFEPGQWKGPTPKYAGDSLPKTIAKLHAQQPIKLLLLGDSISAGGNASLLSNTPPYCPAYGELVAQSLESHFHSKVTLVNKAVDGTTSKDGLSLAKEGVGKEKPDLVIIAYGMNDVYRRHDAAKFKANILGIINQIRTDAPDAEFILVAPMLQNVERGIPMDNFPLYRDALRELCGPGVALADLTSIWTELLKHKTYYDLTGNGLNHPNDFGHCVYAQTLLALLIDAPRK